MNEPDSSRRPTDETRWSESPWLLLKGFLMGAADIVPGVSGGTMALITGIYDRLIHAIRGVDLPLVRSLLRMDIAGFFRQLHWRFLLLLMSGIISAVLFFTRVIPLQIYMHTHPELIFGLFFGLILGSALFLLREIDGERTVRSVWGPVLLGTGFGFWVVNMVPTSTPETPLFLLVTGMISFCAMILPGISGSYFLVLLGKYDYILSLIGNLGAGHFMSTALTLLPFFIGGALGLGLFSRLLSWLLDRYHTVTLAILIGFLFGTLVQIWPWQERIYESEVTDVRWESNGHPEVEQLRIEGPLDHLPEYDRLAPSPARGDSVRIERIEQSLVQSHLYIPGRGRSLEDSHPLSGAGGMVAGLLLVGVLERLRRKQ